jgi:hypothetical protein
MGYLFNDIADVKTFIGPGANRSVDIADLDPILEETLHEDILPYLGEETWNLLVDHWNDDGNNNEALDKLIPFVQKPLAMLTMNNYMSVGTISVGAAGAHRNENEDEGRKTAYKYQVNEFRDYYLNKGWDALERMLKFLEKNKADYPLWDNSDEATNHRSLFLNYASDFKKAFLRTISRYTFEILRPVIEEAEELAIKPLLGKAQYEDLKDEPSDEQKKVIPLLQKAIAHLTMSVAIRRTWVKVDGKKVVQAETLEPQGYVKEGVASMKSIASVIEEEKEFAARWLTEIKDYLEENIDTFPLYKAHIDAIAAAEEQEEETNHNERCGSCGHYTCCCDSYKKSNRRGVINL